MKLAAIICEYNPFHNGHQFHIAETRRTTGADGIVAIMSGNFVQRGDVAVFDKTARAKAAVLGGADLVIELPCVYSSASAEFFALNAIKILNALGNIDFLSFGAENAQVSELMKIARLFADESQGLSEGIKKHLGDGLSFPLARSKAVEEILGEDCKDLLASPNNILGIEYCKALIRTNSTICPCPVLRYGAQHDSLIAMGNIASATHIRDLVFGGEKPTLQKFVPSSAFDIFKDAKIHSLKVLERAILAHIVKMPAMELECVPDVTEGLENRIKAAALETRTLDGLIDRVKTKRYTHSRIRRIVLSAFLGITKEMRLSNPQYIHILAHNETGQKIIANAKKTAVLPIVRNTAQVNRLKDPLIKSVWGKEQIFDRIYHLTEV